MKFQVFCFVVKLLRCLLAFFSVYLVDGVTGATIHHTTHRNAAVPVNLVVSENWIVVSHTSVAQLVDSQADLSPT